VGKPEGEFHLIDSGVDVRIILKCMLEKGDGRVQIVFICYRIWTSVGCCEHGDEPMGFIKWRGNSSLASELIALQKEPNFHGAS
jgi:hypothetical protein